MSFNLLCLFDQFKALYDLHPQPKICAALSFMDKGLLRNVYMRACAILSSQIIVICFYIGSLIALVV